MDDKIKKVVRLRNRFCKEYNCKLVLIQNEGETNYYSHNNDNPQNTRELHVYDLGYFDGKIPEDKLYHYACITLHEMAHATALLVNRNINETVIEEAIAETCAFYLGENLEVTSMDDRIRHASYIGAMFEQGAMSGYQTEVVMSNIVEDMAHDAEFMIMCLDGEEGGEE